MAIIGMACRFPGGGCVNAFWDLLMAGGEAVGAEPERDLKELEVDTIVRRRGGFLKEVDLFDASFFGISPRECQSLDPQHRLLLEVSWEAFEDAGFLPDDLRESDTGVFVGMTSNDYCGGSCRGGGAEGIDGYYITGNALNGAAGRLSYHYGFHGPSMAIDTACSSSLVAVHAACQNLQLGECRLALAAGVNLILGSEGSVAAASANMLSPKGQCRTFDAEADGFVRGEGCGVVLVKRLRDACDDGDRIHAVIAGSAVNQDGPSSGLTVPFGEAQRALIRKALRGADVAPHEISYLEAHGTGTSLGDPIEVNSAAEALCEGRSESNPLRLGSVKANIGHLEAAAGIAGLIKTARAISQGVLPPQRNFDAPNPHIHWDQWPLKVVKNAEVWAANGHARSAGVSSFGATGTNAHVVLQEAPPTRQTDSKSRRDTHLLTLSAKSQAALDGLREKYIDLFAAKNPPELERVCQSARTARSVFKERCYVVGSDAAEVVRELREQVQSGSGADRIPSAKTRQRERKTAFLFTGQGSQYAGMGRQLFESEARFRESMQECDRLFEPHLGRSILSVMWQEESGDLLNDTRYTQAALFAIEVSLGRLWLAWGVKPQWLLGHSIGEYSAAALAEVFSLEDGVRLVAERGRLLGGLSADGGMMVIGADEKRVRGLVQEQGLEVDIAALNGPANTTISGYASAIERAAEVFGAAGLSCRKLKVSQAFHSPLVEPVLQDFEAFAGRIDFQPPRIPLISNVSGEQVGAEICSAEYWGLHLRHTVRFEAGLRRLLEDGVALFVETGPSPHLAKIGRTLCSDPDVKWIPSLEPGAQDWQTLNRGAGEIFCSGRTIDWRAFDQGHECRRVDLPSYAWDRQRYWWPRRNTPKPRANGAGMDKPPFARNGEHTAESSEDTSEGVGDEGFYEVAWRERQLRATTTSEAHFPDPEHIKAGLASRMAEWEENRQLAEYGRGLAGLEELAGLHIVRALTSCGFRWQAGAQYELSSLASELGITPAYERLFRRSLRWAEQEGCLRFLSDDLIEVGRRPEADDEALKECSERLLTQFPNLPVEIALLNRCGEGMAGVLRGTQEALPLLFPEGGEVSAAHLYRDSPAAEAMNELAQLVLREAVERAQPGRQLRVLEVGAGTGATTERIVSQWPGEPPAYTFTDVSGFFVQQGRERLGRHAFMDFRVLDVEQSTLGQGFEPRSYDIIIAANVLHACRDLSECLTNLREVCAPGGMIVLLEGTARLKFLDVVFGLTEGWWRYEDLNLRPDYPLISADAWVELLRESGFEDGIALTSDDSDQGIFSNQAILVAKRSSEDISNEPSSNKCGWLVFADRGGVGNALVERLAEANEPCFVAGSEAGQGHPAEFALVEADADKTEFISVLKRLERFQRIRIVHLWSLDDGEQRGGATTELQFRGMRSALTLTQAVLSLGWERRTSLCLVSREAVMTGQKDGVYGFGQAPLWGFARSLRVECPDLDCVLADVDDGQADRAADFLWQELNQEGAEKEVAWRRGIRLVSRLSPMRVVAEAPTPATEEGWCLITGGTRGLGMFTAERLLDLGIKRFLLVSRSGAAVEDGIQALRERGALVRVAEADVADRAAMESLLRRVRNSEFGPLRGVVHSAGALDDGVIPQLNWDRFQEVFRAKVRGAWNLHLLTQGDDLEFFVMFSSVASLLGSPGQANHAAANSFMDALAGYRRSRGQAAVSINWGPWETIGAASGAIATARAARAGMEMVSLDLGARALDVAFSRSPAQFGVAPILWPEFRRSFAETATPVFFSEIPAMVEEIGETRSVENGKLLHTIQDVGLSDEDRKAALEEYLLTQTRDILGMSPQRDLDLEAPLNMVGLDSLMATELKNRVATSLQTEVTIEQLISGDSLLDLTERVFEGMKAPLFSTEAEETELDEELMEEVVL